MTVGYVPGRDNGIADIMSRWAYPACENGVDISIHGDPEQDKKMKEIIEAEKAEEKHCCVVSLAWPIGLKDEYENTGKMVEVLVETRRPRTLDIICGTQRWSRPFADMGWEVHTLDFNPRFRPTICCDVLEWNPQEYPPGFFDVIVASPPCQLFFHCQFANGPKICMKVIVWCFKRCGSLSTYNPRYGLWKTPGRVLWSIGPTCKISPLPISTNVNLHHEDTKK